MTSDWLNTESDAEARARAERFWAQLGSDIESGEFWADRIKQVRDQPDKRLHLALENLPLPGAFREAAIAVRALIRQKQKAGDPPNEELAMLYWLAALRSFMLDYAPRLQQPGFNVVEAMPGKVLRSLSFSYRELGYENLELLNKTDVKWIREAWGEPDSHTTLAVLHREVWEEYESKLLAEQKASRRKLRAELETSTRDHRSTSSMDRRRGSGCSMALVFLGGVSALGILLGELWLGS